jgi:hypothetical membrane protein
VFDIGVAPYKRALRSSSGVASKRDRPCMAQQVAHHDSLPRERANALLGWRVPGWTLAPAVAAPVLLLAGLVIAPTLQPPGYDSVRDTISALAARDAVGRNVMTASVIGLGVSYIATAVGLVGARLSGRLALGAGGMGTVLVGLFPLPTGTGGSAAHAMSATIAVCGMTLWPLGLTSRRTHRARPRRPFPARLPVASCATIALLLLFVWFGVEQWTRWGHVGLSERVAACAQSAWPLIVVVTARTGQWPMRQLRRRRQTVAEAVSGRSNATAGSTGAALSPLFRDVYVGDERSPTRKNDL